MKKHIFTLILVTTFACNNKTPHPNYIEISGKIVNAKSKEISFYGMGGPSKKIPLKENGKFKDTLKVLKGRNKYQLSLAKDEIMALLYLENGANLSIKADVKDFENTLKFDQDLADYNNFLNKKFNLISSENGFKKTWYQEKRGVFDTKITTLKTELEQTLKSFKNISADNVEYEENYINSYIKRLTDKYPEEHMFAIKLAKGTPSPTFKNYENIDGSLTSLSDFKGKYVYIDVWATWCAPCKAQIPFLKELEKEYHGKNITFISMSVDKPRDRDKWLAMVKDKEMSGVQIIAPNATASDFTRAYNITSIPRFILINTEGKIIDFNAPRPSVKEKIKTLFSSLNI
ncbi:TlpA family protein disulfide reductase [Lutibacter sp. A64]|uniref:TlpA family protein disulfide reductase n=1 Tax=Lutibacter sp. A64 TaxID=2918526 RepID=UPI001F051553|nr:TlpA disulfide reductase family protein [Lutibacter sp. A64]UMB52506.1 TlpA family protein disulfide reductase [Lutibacter sp. A64]